MVLPMWGEDAKKFAIGCATKQPAALKNVVVLGFWQGHQGSNPGPTVLETVALPTELYPYRGACYAEQPERSRLHFKFRPRILGRIGTAMEIRRCHNPLVKQTAHLTCGHTQDGFQNFLCVRSQFRRDLCRRGLTFRE